MFKRRYLKSERFSENWQCFVHLLQEIFYFLTFPIAAYRSERGAQHRRLIELGLLSPVWSVKLDCFVG